MDRKNEIWVTKDMGGSYTIWHGEPKWLDREGVYGCADLFGTFTHVDDDAARQLGVKLLPGQKAKVCNMRLSKPEC